MTELLRSLLREDYLKIIKARMIENHWNNTSISRRTGFSKAHIGNVMRGRGSDDAIGAVCQALSINIRDLFKEQQSDKRKAV